jgi:hypothetical protein
MGRPDGASPDAADADHATGRTPRRRRERMSGGLAPVEVERPDTGGVVEPDIPWIVIV